MKINQFNLDDINFIELNLKIKNEVELLNFLKIKFMSNIRYFFQFLIVATLFLIFRIIGIKYSRILSGKIFEILGPLFRSNKISYLNLSRAIPKLNEVEKVKIIKTMWNNYGKILAEYVFIKNFRKSKKFNEKIIIKNQNELKNKKKNS